MKPARSEYAADAADRANRAHATGQPAAGTRSPEVVRAEIKKLDTLLTKRSLSDADRRELRAERDERLAELRRELQQRVANLEQGLKRLGGEDAAAVKAQLTATRAELAALGPSAAAAPAAPRGVPAAQAAVEAAWAKGGAQAAMIELEKQCLALTPADAARLIAAARPVIDQVAKDLMSGDSPARQQALTSLSNAARVAGPAAVEQVAGQLAAQVTMTAGRAPQPRLGNLDNGFASAIQAGAGPDLALAVAAQLRAQGKTLAADQVDKAAAGAIEAPMKAFTEAQQRYAAREAQLAQDLAQFGPGLTPAQRQKYVDAFWSDEKNGKLKAAVEDAEKRLAGNFECNRPALEAAAARGDKRAAELLMKGVEALAQTPNHAREAIAFVERLGQPEQKALFDALNKDGTLEARISDQVLAPALGNAQSKALSDGSMGELLAQLKGIQKLGKYFAKLPKEIGAAVDTVEKVNALLEKGLRGPALMAELRLDERTSGWASKSKLGKALAVFSVVSAIHRAGQTPDGIERLQASLSAVKGGLELAAGVLGTLGRAQKLAGAAGAATLISKMIPGVSLAIDGVQLGRDIKKLTDGGNVGDVISTVGTAVNVVSDLAGFIPIAGTAIDGVLSTVGTIVQGVGGLISGLIEGDKKREQRDADRKKYLEATGASPRDREILTVGGWVDNAALGTMGLSREQFLGALEAMQQLPTDDKGKSAYAAQIAWRAAAAYGLKGQQALDFVKALQKAVVTMSWNDVGRLDTVLNELSGIAGGARLDGMTPAQIREAVADRVQQLDVILRQVSLSTLASLPPAGRRADVNVAFFTTSDQR